MRTCLFPILAIALLMASSCKKDAPEAGLPAATQDGKNTLGCLVDGQVFVPLTPQGINSSKRDPLEASLYHTDLLVSARGNGHIDFALRNAFKPGVYPLEAANTSNKGYGLYQTSDGAYFTTDTHKGTVTLTRIDTTTRVAAGTFQFTALDVRSGKTITITDGRFDVRLR